MSNKLDKSRKSNRIGRRTLLNRMAGGLVAGQILQPGKVAAQTRTAAPGNNSLTLSVVGEIMAVRPFSMLKDPAITGIFKLLRESDVSYGHLEMNFASDDELGWAARGSSGGAGYLVADPKIADELKWVGIDTMSVANNHSVDWGEKGLAATIKNCNKAGIAVAGTGMDLEEARKPAYFEKDKGRMALISLSSGNSAFEWAGLSKGEIPGRPGINPLRVKKVYEVDHASAEQLKAIAKKLDVLTPAQAAAKEFNVTPGASSGSNGYSGFNYLDGNKFEITTEGHPEDIKGNLRSIDEAKQMSDFVMVAHHNSISEARRGDAPCKFVVDFARKAIDAGADIYIGHGWHTALGIEIYKNKPIIYGLGNFFWQSQYIPRVPADEFESYGYSMDELTSLHPSVGSLHPEGNEGWAWSAVYQFKFENKKITEIKLHPIDMGYDFSGEKPKVYRQIGSGAHPYLDGSPRLATGANGQKILDRMQKICGLRGTKMDIGGGIGTIKVPA